MPKKSSSRSKTHPYLNLRNWLPGGQCNFFEGRPNESYYNERLAEQMSKDKSLITFQENVHKNHSI